MTDPPSRYVEGALVTGFAAYALHALMVSPRVAEQLDRMAQAQPWIRPELDAARRALRRAAAEYEALPVAVDGSAAEQLAEAAASSVHEIDTAQAAALLGLSERRIRQLAAEGMGRQVGGRWLLDRGLVLAYGHRRSA